MMTNKDNQQREQRKLVEYYNYYLDGLLSSPEFDVFWNLLYEFSFFFLRNVHANQDIKDDCWEDLMSSLFTMDDYFKHVDDFNELVKVMDYKLKKLHQRYKRDRDLK